MREVLNLHLGGSGITMGEHFWARLCDEHGIDGATGVLNPDAGPVANAVNRFGIDAFFREEEGGKRFVPRGVLADCGCTEIDSSLVASGLFGADQTAVSRAPNLSLADAAAGCNSNFYATQVENRIRRELERCDALASFQVFHSAYGNTGGGCIRQVLYALREMMPSTNCTTFTLLPSKTELAARQQSGATASLATHILTENCDMTNLFCIDSAFSWVEKRRERTGDAVVSSADAFDSIAEAIANFTAGHRFPGNLNAGYAKISTSLIPYPRLHFFTPALAANYDGQKVYSSDSIEALGLQLQRPDSVLNEVKLKTGRTLTGIALFRGADLAMRGLESSVRKYMDRNSSYFVEWIPTNLNVAHCAVSAKRNRMSLKTKSSATVIYNTTAVKEVFKDIHAASTAAESRLPVGMSHMEMAEANCNTSDVVSEYSQYESAIAEGDDEE